MARTPLDSTDSSETEGRILEAAHRVFLRRGTAGARTQEIADEAGVNKALLHYYFRTKDRLAEAVFLRAARIIFPQMLRILSSDLPLREKLQGAIDVELGVLEQNPYLPGYLISEFQYRADHLRKILGRAINVEDMRHALLETLQRQLDAESAVGRIRPTRADDLLVGLISQLVFPFAAAPMLEAMLGLDDAARRAMMKRRGASLADDILRSLAP